MLLIVATPSSAASANVALEIQEFLGTGRAVVIVDVLGALRAARWSSLVSGPEPIAEQEAALAGAAPSTQVIRRVDAAATFVRAKSRIRRYALAALSLISVSAALLVYLQQRVSAAVVAEREAQKRAGQATENATLEGQRAAQARKEAVEATTQRDGAQKSLKVAEAARAQAQAEADDINRGSQSRILAAKAVVEVRTDPPAGLSEALRAFELEATPEAEAAVRETLQTPRPTAILPSRYRDIVFGDDALVTLDGDRRVSVWNSGTGRLLRTLKATNTDTVEVSHSGQLVVTTTGRYRAEVWDAATPNDKVILSAHEDGSILVKDARHELDVVTAKEPAYGSGSTSRGRPDRARVEFLKT
jgi:hypothetical protein